jgi:hypothetical protein
MTTRPIVNRYLIDGVLAYDSPEDLKAGRPTILDGFNLSWGKDGGSAIDQPAATQWSFTVRQQIIPSATQRRMLDVIHVGSTVQVQAVGGGRTVSVWSGQVVSVDATYQGDHAWQIACTASDAATEPANDNIGDNPWVVQDVATRVARIAKLSKTEPPITIDPTLQGYKLTYRDVDKQNTLGLLQEIAVSVGATLWVVEDIDEGASFWFEDARERTPVRRFVIDPATDQMSIGPNDDRTDVAQLDTADLLRDDLHIGQNVADVITSVDLTWQEQTDDEDGKPSPTEQTLTKTDATARKRYGLRNLDVSTQLAVKRDAQMIIRDYLTRSRTSDWSLTGLTIDTHVLARPFTVEGVDPAAELDLIMDLLDGRKRLARAVELTDLPDWTPANVATAIYVEGGAYTWEDGWWQLDLTAFPAGRQGHSATFAEMKPFDITSGDIDQTITAAECQGVAPPKENTVITVLGTDTVVNNSTELVTTGLSISLDQNTIYEVEAWLAFNSPTAADMSLHWSAPGGSEMLWTPTGPAGNAAYPTNVWNLNTAAAGDTVTIGGAGQAIVIRPSGMITTGTVGSALALQFAQKTATAADTKVLAGSWLKVTKVGTVQA